MVIRENYEDEITDRGVPNLCGRKIQVAITNMGKRIIT